MQVWCNDTNEWEDESIRYIRIDCAYVGKVGNKMVMVAKPCDVWKMGYKAKINALKFKIILLLITVQNVYNHSLSL